MQNLSNELYILDWQDGDISIGQTSTTGTHMGEVYLTPDEQIKLRNYLIQRFPLTNDTESKGA